MEYNVIQQYTENSLSIPATNKSNDQFDLKKYCAKCRRNQVTSESSAICSDCISFETSNNLTAPTTTIASSEKQANSRSQVTTPAKRGYKSHVPSACINCKTAHLACDVSRPCQRCVTLKKTDTCQDMQHKKRGRPKLKEKKIYTSTEHNYEILYGTIQTPAITMKNPNRNIIPNNQVPPFKAKVSSPAKRPPIISFIHEPIESFQSSGEPAKATTTTTVNNSLDSNYQQSMSSITTDIRLAFDYSSARSPNTTNLLLESVIPAVQLSTNPQFSLLSRQYPQKNIFFDYDPIDNGAQLLLSDSMNNIIAIDPPQQQSGPLENEQSLTIIMSMEVCCARVSDDTIKFWGYFPQELAHRSFYDFISPKDSDRLARLHRLLLDNAVEIVKSNSAMGDNTPTLPPTERTTSSLFSSADHKQLSIIAKGSRSFSDSIHIKKRSGEYELYKIVVFIGGGLGADLYDVSSLSKQYIVAQFRKHEYEVPATTSTAPIIAPVVDYNAITAAKENVATAQFRVQPVSAFSPLSPLSPTSPSTSSFMTFGNTGGKTSSSLELFKENNSLLRHSDKKLSTTAKFSQMTIVPPSSPPKFNIAPITTATPSSLASTISTQHSKSFNSSLFRRFPASVSSTAAGPSTLNITAPHSVGTRSTGNAMVTHPTQQYFLQTSSSTLNAAASAAQGKTRLSISGPTNNDNTSTSNRKIEMSIRSLLC